MSALGWAIIQDVAPAGRRMAVFTDFPAAVIIIWMKGESGW